MVSISINPHAESEYETAAAWYHVRDVPTARRFAAAFDRALATLTALPEIGVPCDHQCRYWSLRKFPYAIVYRFDGSAIRIVAVTHDRQLPGYWADRS